MPHNKNKCLTYHCGFAHTFLCLAADSGTKSLKENSHDSFGHLHILHIRSLGIGQFKY